MEAAAARCGAGGVRPGPGAENLTLIRRMDELHTEYRFYAHKVHDIVPQPAGGRDCALRGREEPDPGAGANPASAAPIWGSDTSKASRTAMSVTAPPPRGDLPAPTPETRPVYPRLISAAAPPPRCRASSPPRARACHPARLATAYPSPAGSPGSARWRDRSRSRSSGGPRNPPSPRPRALCPRPSRR